MPKDVAMPIESVVGQSVSSRSCRAEPAAPRRMPTAAKRRGRRQSEGPPTPVKMAVPVGTKNEPVDLSKLKLDFACTTCLCLARLGLASWIRRRANSMCDLGERGQGSDVICRPCRGTGRAHGEQCSQQTSCDCRGCTGSSMVGRRTSSSCTRGPFIWSWCPTN